MFGRQGSALESNMFLAIQQVIAGLLRLRIIAAQIFSLSVGGLSTGVHTCGAQVVLLVSVGGMPLML